MMNEMRLLNVIGLKAALHDGREIALLDAREEVPFSYRHLLMASCIPLSRLEILIDAGVPRRSSRVVWCDDGEGLAQRAAERMKSLGYTDVSVLSGGIAAWEAAGFRIYSGVHVPSKAFAEVIEHTLGTPWITVGQLKDWIDSKADIALFDSRSFEEFHGNSIPTAVSVPGAELVYRFADLVASPATTVVVNCGGRTRSIIGAQSLINAGVTNKVVSLRNGTQEWHLSGFQILKGSVARPPAVSNKGHMAARKAAQRVAEKFNIPRIDEDILAQWQLDSETRTLYVFDVRTPEEYLAGHNPGMKNVPGGQLVQETDRHAVTWGARVVLVDDDGVRAVMTAHWMKQMGWDVATLTLDMRHKEQQTGPWFPRILGYGNEIISTMDALSLHRRLRENSVSVVDIDWSRDYIAGHVPGAYYGIRSRLNEIIAELPETDIVITSSDGILAKLAVAELSKTSSRAILALEGGNSAWRNAGYPLEQGATRMATIPDDIRLKAREQAENVEEAMKEYLAWEINLVNQMAADDDQRFNINAR